MNEERLGSPEAFARELALHLGAIEEGGPEMPAADDLARLVEVSFFGSLHEEEARRTEFTLAWTTQAPDCAAILAMRAPVVLTPKNIARLAPAVQREATSLAVRRAGDALVIWALLQHGATEAAPLTIRSLGAGVLRVDYLEHYCGRLAEWSQSGHAARP